MLRELHFNIWTYEMSHVQVQVLNVHVHLAGPHIAQGGQLTVRHYSIVFCELE